MFLEKKKKKKMIFSNSIRKNFNFHLRFPFVSNKFHFYERIYDYPIISTSYTRRIIIILTKSDKLH